MGSIGNFSLGSQTIPVRKAESGKCRSAPKKEAMVWLNLRNKRENLRAQFAVLPNHFPARRSGRSLIMFQWQAQALRKSMRWLYNQTRRQAPTVQLEIEGGLQGQEWVETSKEIGQSCERLWVVPMLHKVYIRSRIWLIEGGCNLRGIRKTAG